MRHHTLPFSVILEACLPTELQGPATKISRIAAGLSGAGVYRVEASEVTYALKISDESELAEHWRGKLRIQCLAADAGLAPRVVHVDESRRSVLSAFVTDTSFPAHFSDPRTRDSALVKLGTFIRRLHQLPIPADAPTRDARTFLADIATGLETDFNVPPFVLSAMQWALTHEPPPSDQPDVLSHNDVNPSNLVYDGKDLLLLDWDTAGRNDPYHDLATIAVFLRMDADTCCRLIAIHDAQPVSHLSPRFLYVRRLVATLIGGIFMRLARESGHGGAGSSETLESSRSLGDCYQAMREGTLNLATSDGQFAFGMALVKESLEF
ncbi:MAG: phosphotransferase [Gemmatimonadaceae bacterium]